MLAIQTASELGITDAEFVRLSIIWLQQGIRKDEIKRIQNCKIICGDNTARQWSRENHGKPPSEQIANLKQALQESQQLFDYMNEVKAHKRFMRQEESRSMPGSMRATIDKELAAFNELQAQWFDDLVNGDSIEDIKSKMAFNFMGKWKVDWDTAMLIVDDDFLDKKDTQKMKPIDKMRLIQRGRAKASETEGIEEKRLRDLKDSHEEEMRKWEEYRESLPKTWTAFVDGVRLGRHMTCKSSGDPFPGLPDPLPRNFPMPANWPPEDIWPDDGRDNNRTFYFWMQNCKKYCNN